MEFFQQHTKAIIAGGVLVIGVVLLLLLLPAVRFFLGARIPAAPVTSESIIGGRLTANNLPAGNHTLQFRAKTTDGKVISDTVAFSVGTSSEQTAVQNSTQPCQYYRNDPWVAPTNRGASAALTNIAQVSAQAADGQIPFMPDAGGRIHGCPAKEITSIFEYMSPSEIADAKAGTMQLDLTASIQKAVTAAATSHRVLDFEGITGKISNRIIVTGHDFELIGNGAKILRTTTTNATTVFFLKNVQRANISGFFFTGQHDGINGSTGSNPTMQLGELTDPQDNTINEDIEISHNYLYKGNSGILVTGRHGTENTLKNRRIWIHDNILERVGVGVFIYKNAEDIVVSNNIAKNTGGDSYVIDTRAQTDPTASGRVARVAFRDNVGIYAGQAPGHLGIGILFKGLCQACSASGNAIVHVGSAENNNPQYGVLLTLDFEKHAPQDIVVEHNLIQDIAGNSSGAWSIYINAGASNVAVRNNIIDTAKRGVYINGAQGVALVNNTLTNQALVANTFPVQINATSGTASDIQIKGNTIERGNGNAQYGISIINGSSLQVESNTISGFPGGEIHNPNNLPL